MRKYTKALLTSALAAMILTAAVGTASARNLSISNQNIRVVWERLTLEGGIEDVCEVTLEGTFHYRTMVKSAGALIGYITRAAVANCSLPTTTGLNLPWHIRYQGFSGALPNITLILVDLVNASFLVNAGIAGCLFRSTATRPARGRLLVGAGGVVTGLTSDETAPIPLERTLFGFGCPTQGFLSGTGTVTQLGTATRITVRLI